MYKLETNDKLFSKLGKQMYIGQGFFEIIQNSKDQKSTEIKIFFNEKNNSIIIIDNGTGQTHDELMKLNIGKSSSKKIIGEYGLGLCLYIKNHCYKAEICSISLNELINYQLIYKDEFIYVQNNTMNNSLLIKDGNYNDTYKSLEYFTRHIMSDKLKIKHNGFGIELFLKKKEDLQSLKDYFRTSDFKTKLYTYKLKVFVDNEIIKTEDFLNEDDIKSDDDKYSEEKEDFCIKMTNSIVNREKNKSLNRKIQVCKNGIALNHIHVNQLYFYEEYKLPQKTGNANPYHRLSVDIKNNYDDYIITNEDKSKIKLTKKLDEIIANFLKNNLKQYNLEKKNKNKEKQKEDKKHINNYKNANTNQEKIKYLENNKMSSNALKELCKEEISSEKHLNILIEYLKLKEKYEKLKKKK